MSLPVPIRGWSLASQAEPIVRIGLILAEDSQARVLVRIACDTCELFAGERTIARPRAGDDLVFSIVASGGGSGGAVTVTHNNSAPTTAPIWRLTPVHHAPLARGAGILVRDVPAGRGFHWQKRADQTYPATLEIRPTPAGLVVMNELPLDDYLAGVITAEMSGACPVEFLKAQCVVARSWLLALTAPKHADTPFARCNATRAPGTSAPPRSPLQTRRAAPSC